MILRQYLWPSQRYLKWSDSSFMLTQGVLGVERVHLSHGKAVSQGFSFLTPIFATLTTSERNVRSSRRVIDTGSDYHSSTWHSTHSPYWRLSHYRHQFSYRIHRWFQADQRHQRTDLHGLGHQSGILTINSRQRVQYRSGTNLFKSFQREGRSRLPAHAKQCFEQYVRNDPRLSKYRRDTRLAR